MKKLLVLILISLSFNCDAQQSYYVDDDFTGKEVSIDLTLHLFLDISNRVDTVNQFFTLRIVSIEAKEGDLFAYPAVFAKFPLKDFLLIPRAMRNAPDGMFMARETPFKLPTGFPPGGFRIFITVDSAVVAEEISIVGQTGIGYLKEYSPANIFSNNDFRNTNAIVKIYNLNGALVRTGTKDDYNLYLPIGSYIYIAETKVGLKYSGKFKIGL
ncbi:MAG TPA: hypothetical protein VF691_10090 [Cytophagaceae bacterium]|jgi:hypothetical protein